MPTVTLGGMSLTGVDVHSVIWQVAEVDGWFGSSVRAEILTAPGVPGGFAGEWVADADHVSVRGTIDASGASALLVALEALMATCDAATAAEVPLTVDMGAGPKTLQVRLADKPMTRALTDRVVMYEVQLVAPDPTKT